MKSVAWTALGLALAAQMASAQVAPTNTHSLSLDVTVTGTGGASRAHSNFNENLGATTATGGAAADQKDYSSGRKKKSALGLSVEVRNLARAEDRPTVEWYFFSEPVGKHEFSIFDSGTKDLAVNAGQSQTFPLESKELTQEVERHLHQSDGITNGIPDHPSASVKKSGDKIAGWLVRLLADGKLLQVRASSPQFEALGKDDAGLKSFQRK